MTMKNDKPSRDETLKKMLDTAPKTHDELQQEKRNREMFEDLMKNVKKAPRHMKDD